MAEKLSWTELRRALASRADVSEKNAGVFLGVLVSQITEGLKSDKQVKINGLGTFKLQAVAPRKSVNVSTGEEIIIEGYNKIVFTPEAGVKELVESGTFVADRNQAEESGISERSSEPAAGEFPVDPIKKLGEQADEIVGLLADLGQGPEEPEAPETQEVPEEPKEPEIPEEPEEKEEPAVVVPEPEIVPEPVIVQEPVVAPAPEVIIPTPKAVEEEPEIIVQRPKKEKKKHHFFRDLLICLLILLLLLAGGYYFFREEISGWMEKLLALKAQTEQVEPADQIKPEEPSEEDSFVLDEADSNTDPAIALIPEGAIPQEQILDEWRDASGEQQAEGPYSDLITTEEIREGSRLTWIAQKHYGDKRFWPYLYDANRDRITNPNHIEIGTPIRVPRLTEAQKDMTNAESKAKLEQLRIEAEAACK